jgi:AcrR family transcriptional regulator
MPILVGAEVWEESVSMPLRGRSKAKTASKTARGAKRARPPVGPRATQKRDERRGQLLAAAREIFGELGYHVATVDDITRRAGVAKGTFYLYYSEKKEIYYDLVRTFFQHIMDIGASVAHEVHTPAEFYARSEAAATRLLQVFAEHHSLARLAYRESASLDPHLERMMADFYRRIALVEAENIKAGIRLGIFRTVDPLVTAYAHIGMVERVALSLHQEQHSPAPAHVVRELLSIAFEGLRAR